MTGRPLGVALVAGIAAAGLAGAGVVPFVGATLCSLLAWNAGRYGISLGERLGRGASTTRLELAHVTATAAVGTAAAALGSVTYLAVGATTDGVAIVVLLVGVGPLVLASDSPSRHSADRPSVPRGPGRVRIEAPKRYFETNTSGWWRQPQGVAGFSTADQTLCSGPQRVVDKVVPAVRDGVVLRPERVLELADVTEREEASNSLQRSLP